MYCLCGCGRVTKISDRTISTQGIRKGDHRLFLKGHAGGMAMRRVFVTPDLWAETDLGFETPCWIWKLGSKNRKTGHCHVWIGGTEYSAHRTVYELYKGRIPDGLELDHLCRNPKCVNPDHLEPVTRAENTRRSPVTKLTRDAVLVIRAEQGMISAIELAKRHGVTRGTIYDIWERKSWRDV